MRLLEVLPNGEFRLTKNLLNYEIPRYAILSHRWGNQEVTFEDIHKESGQMKDDGRGKAGFEKIKFCSEQAAKDGLQYFWVDSCCIDKSSSAVLSESINSMFRWYKNAAKCYVYMADVSTRKRQRGDEDALKTWEQMFRKSEWFTRGWTLQELLAPTIIEFFSSDGQKLGDRETLKEQIHEITGISFQALEGSPMNGFSVSERRSWAESRVTTIPEDGAYCLMGLFDISMATRYGEGKEKAFERLDNKIKKANMATENQQLTGDGDAAKKREAILRWLSPPDPSTNYQKALKLRQAETGLWFLGNEQYAKWKASPSSFIWLHGIPGCGKTILSSTIIEDVLQHCTNDPGKAVAYFYFDFKDRQKQSSELMIKSLVTQLFQQCIKIPPLLESLFVSSDTGQQQLSTEALLYALRQISKEFPATYIILDALDECADREELMAMIETLVSWQLESLHVIVTSRKERDIESSLESLVGTCNIMPLQSAVVDEDIQKYVRHRTSVDKKLKKWRSSEIQAEIETALIKGAHGMFRWAVCQLDSLGNCVSRAMLRRSLNCLPPTLDETYEQILCAIHEGHATQALRILRWLAFSSRSLSLEEVAEVVAVHSESCPVFDKDEVLEDPLDALNICASLVTVSSQDNVKTEYKSDDKTKKSGKKWAITLAHYSVKEYLTSERIQNGPAKTYSLQENTSNIIIANSCLGYLLHFQDAESFSRETVATHKLARYSAKFWIDHARSYNFKENSTQKLVMELLSAEDGAFLNWIRIHDLDRPWRAFDIERQAADVASPLYYASLAGLTESVRSLLLDAGAAVNAQGGWYGNALQVASDHGHEAVVKLLLDAGADVDAQGGWCSNALQAASDHGHKAVVKLLLDAGANVNAQGGHCGNALQVASSHGHEAVVKLLLDAGANVNAQGRRYSNALQAASSRSHEAVVKLLLNAGADVNAQSGHYGNALQAASNHGHEAVVKLLLDAGANVNAQGRRYGNALQVASDHGHEAVVKLLLDAGANVNAQGRRYSNALQAASDHGHEAVVKLLLDASANVNAQGGHYGNALQAASSRSHEAVVKLLLDAGANVNAQGGHYGNALQAASSRSHEAVVKLLLDAGANVNAQGGHYGNALQAASSRGHKAVVKLLLDAGTIYQD